MDMSKHLHPYLIHKPEWVGKDPKVGEYQNLVESECVYLHFEDNGGNIVVMEIKFVFISHAFLLPPG